MVKTKIRTGGRPDFQLLSGLFFRLLPYQILLIVISAANNIVDSLFASNMIGDVAMSAIGLYAPMNHFLYVFSIMLVSGSQLLYGLYLGKNPERIHQVFSVDIICRGYTGALSHFVEMFRCLIVNMLIMKCVGSVGLSSFAATNSLLGVIWALPFGMGAVLRMLLSISIGEKDRRSLIDGMRIIFRRGVPLMCAVSAILILLAYPLTRLFYHDMADPVYDMTVMGFRLLPACMPLAVISLNFVCYAQAIPEKGDGPDCL